MKPFNHKTAKTLDDAVAALQIPGTEIIAGGTDLLGTLKDAIIRDSDYPNTVVDIKKLGLDYIREENGTLRIGATTRLADIAESEVIRDRYTALAEAAKAVASPNIRHMGTIGGNLAQQPRCWYFRKLNNRFDCIRKGGPGCFAETGDNRYHSIFGGVQAPLAQCANKCPAGTDIPGYLERIRKGDWDGAAELILKHNPMPMMTGRICAHFCQDGCNRCSHDEAVNVNAVERTLADYIVENADKFYKAPETETGKTVAIIGAGPAGLAAAYYQRVAGNKVTVYETKPEAGGMLMYAIPAYRLPKDIVRNFTKLLEGMGIEFKLGTTLGKDVDPVDLERKFDSVLYTTGAWKRPVLGLAGEELTVFGLDFLSDIEKWMDGKVGTDVMISGGGNVAMDVAVTAKRLGAKNVTLACLEPRDRMPASDEEVARAEEEGIKILPGWGLSKVVEESGVVKGLEIKRCLSPWDETGRFNPQYDENDKQVVPAQNVLMATGQGVDTSFLGEKYTVQLNRGRIEIDEEEQATSREGVFAAGDVTTGTATVIGGIAAGHRASNGINRYLGVNYQQIAPKASRANRYTTICPSGLANKHALKLAENPANVRDLVTEDSLTPSKEAAAIEAERCLNCGCYTVNPSDTAPALIALGAKIVTTARTIDAEDLFSANNGWSNTILSEDEIITEIRLPAPLPGQKSTFVKMALRKSIDFPLVNVAVSYGGKAPRICLNAVAPKPYRAYAAEEVLAGKAIDEATAAAAGEAAVAEAVPFEATKYKVQIAKTLVKRALLSLK
jgi:NADPH-dependent glutamate synthase beta subunit-like oxidoreductase